MSEIAFVLPRSRPAPPPARASRAVGAAIALALAAGLGFVAGERWAGAAPDPARTAALEGAAPEPPPPIRLELPREYREWLPEPVTFDHMFRSDPPPRFR